MAARTCREELLVAVRIIVREKGINEFTPDEVIKLMKLNGSRFSVNTIRTHIISKCCINANKNHQITFDDYRRMERGKYELINH